MTQVIRYLVDALSLGSTYALLALGLTLVFSVMNLINFAYGMFLVWSGYIAIFLINHHVPTVGVVILCILFTTALSMATGRIAFRPFLTAPPTTLLITSFGVELVLQYAVIVFFGVNPQILVVPQFFNETLHIGAVGIPSIELVTIGVTLVTLVLLYLVLNRSSFGIRVRAAAEKPQVSRLMGVKPSRVLAAVFAISGAIAGVVGLLWFARAGAIQPTSDLDPTLKAFVAIILGGLGSLRGAIVGGLALGGLETLMTAVLPSGPLVYQDAIVFGIVIAILLFRPSGIMGSRVGLS